MLAKIQNRVLLSLLVLIYVFLMPENNVAQVNFMSFEERVEIYRNQNPIEFVFVHTDRNVYSPGEALNFKAYMKDLYNTDSISASQNLHLAIYDLSSNMVQEKIFKLINGQADGAIRLLGNIMEGEYNLVAWSNLMESGPAENVFRKKIFIKPRMLPEIFINMNAGDTPYLPGDLARVKVELSNIYGKPLKRKKLNYTISLNGTVFETGDTRANKEGVANIDFNVPESTDPGLVIMEVAAEQLSSAIVSNILVPTSKTPIWVDFVPEGGILVNGLESRIGFKAYDYLGNPVEIEGQVIDKENVILADIKSDKLGFGSFSLKADKTKPAIMRLTSPAGIDIDFSLPPVQESVVQLALKSRDKNNLYFNVNSDIKDASISLHAIAEANGALIYNKRFALNTHNEITVPVDNAARPGVVKVILLSGRGQIVAHRSVFLYEENPGYLAIQNTDFNSNPASVSLKAVNSGNEEAGLSLSLSATDKMMAPDWAYDQDIMSWFLLGREGSFAAFPAGFLANPSENDKLTIDNFMLFHMTSDLDWGEIKSGKLSENQKTNNDFRQELESYLLADNFELLISEIRKNQFFSRYYLERNPGFTDYIFRNKGSLEGLGYLPVKLDSDEQIQKQLAQGQSIMSVLMSIKPYKIMDGKIVFRGNDSFNYQGGVIIVIDGVPRGTNPSVLNSVSPLDVKSIRASANISDIQKYTGLNSTGVIEITTKGANNESGAKNQDIVIHPTIKWESLISVYNSAPFSLKIPINNIETELSIILQGIGTKGRLYIWNNN